MTLKEVLGYDRQSKLSWIINYQNLYADSDKVRHMLAYYQNLYADSDKVRHISVSVIWRARICSLLGIFAVDLLTGWLSSLLMNPYSLIIIIYKYFYFTVLCIIE